MEIQVGDYLNGFMITKIEQDPFIPDQTNIWTNGTTYDTFGNQGVVVFRYKKGQGLSERELDNIFNGYMNKYWGKYIKTDDGEWVKISNIHVDYRKNARFMDRVEDEWGNMHFISELNEVYDGIGMQEENQEVNDANNTKHTD